MYDDYYDDDRDPGPDLGDIEFICRHGHTQPTANYFCNGPALSPRRVSCGKQVDNSDPTWGDPCVRCQAAFNHSQVYAQTAIPGRDPLPPGIDCSWGCVPKKQQPKRDPWDSFSEPGSGSALRCATFGKCWDCDGQIDDNDDYCRHCGARLNPRKHSCPQCDAVALTSADKARGYVCDRCADKAEGLVPQY